MKYVCLMIGGFYVRFSVPFGLDVGGAGPGDSTIFRRTELGNGQITLQLVSTGGFLNARNGAVELGGQGPESAWTEAWWPNDQISLRSSFRLFLCAERGGGNQLVANRDAAGAWEKFFYAQPPAELLPQEPGPPARATLGKRKLPRDPAGSATDADLDRAVPRLDNP